MNAPWFAEALYEFCMKLANQGARSGVRRIELDQDLGASVGIAPGTSAKLHTPLGEVEVHAKLETGLCPLCLERRPAILVNGVVIVGCECIVRAFPGHNAVAIDYSKLEARGRQGVRGDARRPRPRDRRGWGVSDEISEFEELNAHPTILVIRIDAFTDREAEDALLAAIRALQRSGRKVMDPVLAKLTHNGRRVRIG